MICPKFRSELILLPTMLPKNSTGTLSLFQIIRMTTMYHQFHSPNSVSDYWQLPNYDLYSKQESVKVAAWLPAIFGDRLPADSFFVRSFLFSLRNCVASTLQNPYSGIYCACRKGSLRPSRGIGFHQISQTLLRDLRRCHAPTGERGFAVRIIGSELRSRRGALSFF